MNLVLNPNFRPYTLILDPKPYWLAAGELATAGGAAVLALLAAGGLNTKLNPKN